MIRNMPLLQLSRLLRLLLALTMATTAALVHAFDYPPPNLPLGDINVVVVTDVHSWVGGHKKENPAAADYGDVLSFVTHLKQYAISASADNKDVFFVMNGDWIDGTGLAMDGDVSRLVPILQHMPWDALTLGNHELYNPEVIRSMTRIAGMVEWFNQRYLTSNVLHNSGDQPLPIGNRYHIMQGNHYNVLTFGFLYDMTNNAKNVQVDTVEATVQEAWFKAALLDNKSNYDAILVLAHMDVRDALVSVILQKIRALVGTEMPVQFITGHTHTRDYAVLDEASTSFEAGRYLDTVGFVSFPAFENNKKKSATAAPVAAPVPSNATAASNVTVVAAQNEEPAAATAPLLFQHRFLDANVQVLAETLGLSAESFPTVKGTELSDFILRVQVEMGLTQEIGCTTESYRMNRTLWEHDSLWKLFTESVVPNRFTGNQVLLLENGAWRYDLIKGSVTVDDAIAVSPFNSSLWIWQDAIPAQVLYAVNKTLNEAPPLWESPLPQYILASAEPYDNARNYSLIVEEFDLQVIKTHLDAAFANSSTAGEAVPPPLPVELADVTTTSIWLDFFKENSHGCKKHKNQPTTGSSSSSSGGGGGLGSSNIGASGFASANPDADGARLLFVAASVVVIAVLGSIAVWQKSVQFRHHVQVRDFATLEAMREYEQRDGDDDYDDEHYGVDDGELI